MANPNKAEAPFAVYPPGPDFEKMEERLRIVEEDVLELRGVVTRFGDLFVGERSPETKPAVSAPAAPAAKKASMLKPSGWLPFELLGEFRQMGRMYIDPRYRMRRTTQLMVPAVIAVMVGVYLFFNYVFSLLIVASIVEKLLYVILSITLYKILSNELVRYREALATFDNWSSWRRGSAAHLGDSDAGSSPMEMNG